MNILGFFSNLALVEFHTKWIQIMWGSGVSWILNLLILSWICLCLFFLCNGSFRFTSILNIERLIKPGFFVWNHNPKNWTKFDKTGCRRTILVSSSPNMIHKKFLSDTQIAICPEIKMTTLWWQTSLRHFTPTVKKMWQKSSFGESTLEPKTFLSYI